MFSSYQEMYYASKSVEFIVRKRLDMVHMALDCGYKPTARFYNTDRNNSKVNVKQKFISIINLILSYLV